MNFDRNSMDKLRYAVRETEKRRRIADVSMWPQMLPLPPIVSVIITDSIDPTTGLLEGIITEPEPDNISWLLGNAPIKVRPANTGDVFQVGRRYPARPSYTYYDEGIGTGNEVFTAYSMGVGDTISIGTGTGTGHGTGTWYDLSNSIITINQSTIYVTSSTLNIINSTTNYLNSIYNLTNITQTYLNSSVTYNNTQLVFNTNLNQLVLQNLQFQLNNNVNIVFNPAPGAADNNLILNIPFQINNALKVNQIVIPAIAANQDPLNLVGLGEGPIFKLAVTVADLVIKGLAPAPADVPNRMFGIINTGPNRVTWENDNATDSEYNISTPDAEPYIQSVNELLWFFAEGSSDDWVMSGHHSAADEGTSIDEGTGSCSSGWVELTFPYDHPLIDVADGDIIIPIYTLAPKGVVEDCVVWHTQEWDGTSITQVDMSIGTNLGADDIIDGHQLSTASTHTSFTPTSQFDFQQPRPYSMTNETPIKMRIYTNGGGGPNLSNLTQGSLKVWLKISNLQDGTGLCGDGMGGGGGVTQVNTEYPIEGGPISSTGTISHAESGVDAGFYRTANIEIDEWGHITFAEEGTGGGGGGGGVTPGDKGDIFVFDADDDWAIKADTIGSAELKDDAVITPTIAPLAVTTPKLANRASTFAKIQAINTSKVLGRTTAGTGDIEELGIGTGLEFVPGKMRSSGYMDIHSLTEESPEPDDLLPKSRASVNKNITVKNLLGFSRRQPGGRLSLVSGGPTDDSAASSNLYYMPYLHDCIELWNSTTSMWQTTRFSSALVAGVSLSGLTSGRPYDVFGYLSSGSLATEKLAWNSTTARATEVSIQDGRYCKTGDKSRVYLGTFYASSSTQTIDDGGSRYIWNLYNQVPRNLNKDYSGNWTYGVNTWRAHNGDSTHQVSCILGLESFITIENLVYVVASVSQAGAIGIAKSTALTTPLGHWSESQVPSPSLAVYRGKQAKGWHSFVGTEICRSGVTINFYGQLASGSQSGLSGFFMG